MQNMGISAPTSHPQPAVTNPNHPSETTSKKPIDFFRTLALLPGQAYADSVLHPCKVEA